MSIDWNGYAPYELRFEGPRNELSRSQAREEFEHIMAARVERRDQLASLLEVNGVELSNTDAEIQELNDWLVDNIEESDHTPGVPESWWFAVTFDVAIFLGDVVIDRAPGLHWSLFTAGERDISYQRPVIVGFAKVKNPKYNLDFDRLLATWAYQIVAGNRPPSTLAEVIDHAVSCA